MPQRSLSRDFGIPSGDAPPSYDISITLEEFEAKAVTVAEETRVNHGKQRAQEESGPSEGTTSASNDYGEFEDWDDAKFEAAAAAYQLRLARMKDGADSQNASSSTNRSQSPLPSAGSYNPQVSTSRAISPQPSGRPGGSTPVPNSMHSPAQLPSTQFDPRTQRDLPQPPREAQRGGPSNSHYRQQAFIPENVAAPQVDTTSPPQWTSGASGDGHGRPSMEVPPPFVPMDPSAEFATSPTNESDQPDPTSPQQPPAEVRENPYSRVPPPPPLSHSQAPASAPLQPTSSSPPPASVSPSAMHRHSEVPSRNPNTRSMPVPTRPRLSEPTSANGRSSASSSARASLATFAGPRHSGFAGVLPSQEKKTSQGPSRSQALYASANVQMNAPNISLDLTRQAYGPHGRSQPSHAAQEEPFNPASFYSSSVSSLLKNRAQPLPPPPPPPPHQRRGTAESQYSPQDGSPYSNPYASPYGSDPAIHAAYSPENHGNSGFYPHLQTAAVNTHVQGYPAHFPTPHQPYQQAHHAPPQGYPPTAAQNHWTQAPDRWNTYAHP